MTASDRGFVAAGTIAPMDNAQSELAHVAARLVVQDGLGMGAAKRQALRELRLPPRTALPDNDTVEAAVRDYIAVFCADTQPRELQSLRELALTWMERLQEFRPHIGGAVWSGIATRNSDIYLQLFCDDPKSAEIALIDKGLAYQVTRVTGFQGDPVDALSLQVRCDALAQHVGIHLMIHDHDDLRGALRADRQGRRPRGDRAALLQRMGQDAP
jgi:hypothetical protein